MSEPSAQEMLDWMEAKRANVVFLLSSVCVIWGGSEDEESEAPTLRAAIDQAIKDQP